MIKMYCDACGEEAKDTGHGTWGIDLHFYSSWRGKDTKSIVLCQKCGFRAAHFLGFCYDTGSILSIAQGQYATGESDIPVLTQNPDAPLAGAMEKES
jgi:hypothetical protein